MDFDTLDKQMRQFETQHDVVVLPGINIVARLDGRGFTGMVDGKGFARPFDGKFRDLMVATTSHLMENSGFRILYGYTQSDEISLLLAPDDETFNRKERKINSVLAGEASAKFSLSAGFLASFDCRVCQLPTKDTVVDYFRWRAEDALRNALNTTCYWTLRKEGRSIKQATQELFNASVAQKNELLFSRGINFNDLPAWQKRGIGFYWTNYQKNGVNPLTGESVTALRRRIEADYELPINAAYSEFISRLHNPLSS